MTTTTATDKPSLVSAVDKVQWMVDFELLKAEHYNYNTASKSEPFIITRWK